MATSSVFQSRAGSFLIREGRVDDCSELAYLINESAEGAIDYLFSDFETGGYAAKSMSQLLEHEVYYSFANAIVVEFDKKVIGMALSFPADGLVISEQMRMHYSEDKLQYIRYFVENKIDHCWHLDALCIREQYRNYGAGSKLIEAVKKKAYDHHYDSIGVFVFGSNINALRFYQRHGFIHRLTVGTSGHEFLDSKNNLYLLECTNLV